LLPAYSHSRSIFRGEQCLWAELHDTVDELRQAVTCFVQTYNTQWLIGWLGHRSPKAAYQDAHTTAAA
jgi:hypothetical protein